MRHSFFVSAELGCTHIVPRRVCLLCHTLPLTLFGINSYWCPTFRGQIILTHPLSFYITKKTYSTEISVVEDMAPEVAVTLIFPD